MAKIKLGDEELRIRRNESCARYRARNYDQHVLNAASWYQNNKERQKVKRNAYYALNKEKFVEYSLKYKDANHAALLFRAARLRASKNGREFNIDQSDVIIPTNCPILGVQLIRARGTKSYNSATLDRINNKYGYIKGNVQVISYRANTMKNDASLEEIEKLYFYLKSLEQEPKVWHY